MSEKKESALVTLCFALAANIRKEYSQGFTRLGDLRSAIFGQLCELAEQYNLLPKDKKGNSPSWSKWVMAELRVTDKAEQKRINGTYGQAMAVAKSIYHKPLLIARMQEDAKENGWRGISERARQDKDINACMPAKRQAKGKGKAGEQAESRPADMLPPFTLNDDSVRGLDAIISLIRGYTPPKVMTANDKHLICSRISDLVDCLANLDSTVKSREVSEPVATLERAEVISKPKAKAKAKRKSSKSSKSSKPASPKPLGTLGPVPTASPFAVQASA